jgi:hypothetical protein
MRQNVLRQLYINYDPMIDVILRECELLARYSITMPDLGYKLLLDQNRIRLYYERLKVYRIPQIWQTHSLCRKLPFDILEITEKSFGVIG